jgi:hypothetical protein
MERKTDLRAGLGWDGSCPNGYESHSGGEMSVLDVSPLRGSVAAEIPTVSLGPASTSRAIMNPARIGPGLIRAGVGLVGSPGVEQAIATVLGDLTAIDGRGHLAG